MPPSWRSRLGWSCPAPPVAPLPPTSTTIVISRPAHLPAGSRLMRKRLNLFGHAPWSLWFCQSLLSRFETDERWIGLGSHLTARLFAAFMFSGSESTNYLIGDITQACHHDLNLQLFHDDTSWQLGHNQPAMSIHVISGSTIELWMLLRANYVLGMCWVKSWKTLPIIPALKIMLYEELSTNFEAVLFI